MSITHYPEHFDVSLSVNGNKIWLGRFYDKEQATSALEAGKEIYAEELNYLKNRNAKIRARRKEGAKYKELSSEFGLVMQTVWNVVNKEGVQ